MKPGSVAIVGAAETTELGVIPHMSNIQLHADCALNAMQDAALKLLNSKTKVPVAEYIRQGIELVLAKYKDQLHGQQQSLFGE